MAAIEVLGAPWCPDCKRAKQFLAEQRVDYDWVDIDFEHGPELRASALLQEKARSDAKFEILTNTEVTGFRGTSRVEG